MKKYIIYTLFILSLFFQCKSQKNNQKNLLPLSYIFLYQALQTIPTEHCENTPDTSFTGDDPLLEKEWHIENETFMGEDLNVKSVWSRFKGDDIRIAIIDDGLEITHEDIYPNTVRDGGLNFFSGVDGFSPSRYDPTPQDPPQSGNSAHGTAVAGIAAAKGENGIGISGIAPNSCLVGINLLGSDSISSRNEQEAMLHNIQVTDISNNSWGGPDGYGTLSFAQQTWTDAIETGLSKGRNGKGTIYVWAAGNGANTKYKNKGNVGNREIDNSNYDGRANHYGVLSICGTLNNGKRTYYSEKGANLWVCGYTQQVNFSAISKNGIVTTDITGENKGYNKKDSKHDLENKNYTQVMNGTSAAVPMVSGVVALVLDANPSLSWRDVKLILAESARQNDPNDTEWTTNNGQKVSNGNVSYHINHKYGFGIVDASSAVELALSWENIGAPEPWYDSGVIKVNKPIPEGNNGITDSIIIGNSKINKIEFIEVYLTTSDGDTSGIEVTLEGSLGTESVLAERHACFSSQNTSKPNDSCRQNYNDWRFGDVRHLGETANQTWTIKLAHPKKKDPKPGVFVSWKLRILGRK